MSPSASRGLSSVDMTLTERLRLATSSDERPNVIRREFAGGGPVDHRGLAARHQAVQQRLLVQVIAPIGFLDDDVVNGLKRQEALVLRLHPVAAEGAFAEEFVAKDGPVAHEAVHAILTIVRLQYPIDSARLELRRGKKRSVDVAAIHDRARVAALREAKGNSGK